MGTVKDCGGQQAYQTLSISHEMREREIESSFNGMAILP